MKTRMGLLDQLPQPVACTPRWKWLAFSWWPFCRKGQAQPWMFSNCEPLVFICSFFWELVVSRRAVALMVKEWVLCRRNRPEITADPTAQGRQEPGSWAGLVTGEDTHSALGWSPPKATRFTWGSLEFRSPFPPWKQFQRNPCVLG